MSAVGEMRAAGTSAAGQRTVPASLTLSALCVEAGGWLRGPGVPPEPGDRTSSFPWPLKDSEEEGGRCNTDRPGLSTSIQ